VRRWAICDSTRRRKGRINVATLRSPGLSFPLGCFKRP